MLLVFALLLRYPPEEFKCVYIICLLSYLLYITFSFPQCSGINNFNKYYCHGVNESEQREYTTKGWIWLLNKNIWVIIHI